MIFPTIEARWFGQGAVPGAVAAWIAGLSGDPQHQPERRDYYLQPLRDDGLSVKFREGGLEVKQRQRSHGLVQVGDSAEGQVEQWLKWRFPLGESSLPVESIIGNGTSWFAVDKARLLKFYHFQRERIAAGESLIVPSTPACHLELAEVRAGDSRWWTAAIEANVFGEGALDYFVAMAGWLFKDRPPGELNALNSYGYPRWLASLVE